jgi:puromycin-sensitive aminopeptidase
MSNETTALAERDVNEYRLPATVVPEQYEIKLTPDLEKFTFAGQEAVRIKIAAPTAEIVLNAAELEIQHACVKDSKGSKVDAQIAYDNERERASLKFPQTLSPGEYKLHLDFTGVLNDKLHGFYRSSYKNEAGEQKMLASTQFEATDARRAFPCWDEPDLKSTFKVTLVVDKHLTAISNAAIEREEPVAGTNKKAVHFAESMKMSTYLVAFIVGEFEGTDPLYVGKTPIRVWSVPGKKRLASFACASAVASLEFFEQYYGIKYPGDKLDLIAIPDFASGAMENLGAVTFRENALLVDEGAASHAELERIADVVAHELAHMWFGDLVTMKWWNGLWLNEAFATFMEMLAVDAWKPEWKRWDTFGVSRAAAFSTDGLASTRTIEFPVRHPEEAGAMFDVLTYEKGASVLRMLEQYLGEEQFRAGIAQYLKKHAYANAETTDLWDALEESSKQPVRQMMDSWIFQEGHPLVSVELCRAGKALKISQERFLYLPAASGKQPLFHVPVMLRVKTGSGIETKKFILASESVEIEFAGQIEWAVANDGGHGFYRVRYSEELTGKLIPVIWQELNAIERFNLVADTWASTLAGRVPLAEYLKLARMFKDETDKNVWAILIGSLHYLNKVIDSKDRPALETFARKLLSAQKERLGWAPQAGENELTRQLRGMVIGALGTIGSESGTQAQAKELYSRYRADRSAACPNVVPALVSILSFAGDQAQYEEFHNEFRAAKTPQEEQRYLFSLANFRQPELLKQTLAKTTSGEVRTQNAPYLVQSVLANPYGRELAWSFLKEHWDELLKLYPENSIPRMCEGITNLVSSSLEEDVKRFFASHKVKQGGKAIDQHLEKLRIAVSFKEREDKNFAGALA